MDPVRLQRIGNRINILLAREIGQSIDVSRLIGDALYARDVLLVCDALPGSDLASLAQHFRDALAAPALAAATPAKPAAHDGSGFDALPVSPRTPPQALPRRWYSPTRWLGR